MVDVEININGADRVAPALRKGLEEGLKDAGEWIAENGQERAEDAVMLSDRVWRGTVKNAFTTNEGGEFDRYYRWSGEIKNNAPHAEIVEKGLAPAGQITGANPSVQDILPWVSDNLSRADASDADVNEWHPDLQQAAAEYSPGHVLTAFAVKDKIETEGYPGIGFMETTELYLKKVGPPVVRAKVEAAMQRKIREYGLS